MKASELIKELQAQIKKVGDLPVKYSKDDWDDFEVTIVDAYDDDGASIEDDRKNPIIEIFLH